MHSDPGTTWRAPRPSRPPRSSRDHAIQRPLSRRPGQQLRTVTGDLSHQPQVPDLKQVYEWSRFPELTVRLRNLSPHTTTYDIYRNFKMHGTIVLIEIYQGRSGTRDGGGKIRFSPPPREAFWAQPGFVNRYAMRMENGHDGYTCIVEFDERNRNRLFKVRSPINKTVEYDEKMKLVPSSLHFGVMLDPEALMTMQTINAMPGDELSLVVDLLRNRLVATFMVDFKDPRSQWVTDYVSSSQISEYDRKNKFMFQIPFTQLKKIYRVDMNNSMIALVVSLDSPPAFFRKKADEKSCHSNENLVWTEFDSWWRQTDVVYDPYRLATAPVALHKEQPVIDIGRWTTYKFILNTKRNDSSTYMKIKQALQDFNIEIVTLENLVNVRAEQPELWSWIDPSPSVHAATDLQDLEGNGGSFVLPFEVRYQLEVCISRNILNELNITKEFVKTLSEIASEDSSKAQSILEYIAEQDNRIYNPMSIFEDKEALAFSPRSEIPHYCAYSRKATITPTTIYFNSPTVETTNRVLRYYSRENEDGRFLRVQFTDEMAEGRINSCADKQRNDELFTRVYRTLFNGIRIGDRHYEFLAFGNSQFRENGAYFFCPTEHLSCDDIRQWMGNFSHINVVAKYAARLGQCFSTTRAIHGLSKPDIVKIPDVERNGYCFTDGIGKISPFLAQMITAELGLRFKIAPSAFQFRLGGCKGVLVVTPDAKDKEVHIRKSQQKFTAAYNGLEIIRWSRFSCATLNRQTIPILSALGVPDEVFLKMLSEQLSNYQAAMSDHAVAQSLLSKYIDDNHMTINIATMIHNGFMVQREPFVISLLHLWRSWSIKLLKEKAKIIVENGAFLLGCVDETAALRGYSKPTIAPGQAFTEDELPEIFVQVPSKSDANRYNVIEGICLVGRNPSLHPGDLRVVRAVNVPALHHLRDVVVFPQTGQRDIPSMCSGGDLDGDDYFVIWDKELQPLEWNCDPMNYAAPTPKTQTQPVKVTDLMKFFVRFMKNDSLATIAHAHLAQADYLDNGVKDPKCLELATLHSKAVDYVKTGQPAEMPKRLKPPRWPHFMEKRYKPKDATYHSEKILGQLYDKVESVDFIPQYQEPFDRRILRAYKLDDALLKSCRQIKSKYDTAMRRIMAQQEIKTEFEVWSTFVLSRPRVGTDYKVQEVMARYSDDLKNRFRMVCIEAAGSKDFAVLGPFVAGMYRVTKEELDIALAECRSTKLVGGREVPKRKMEPKYMPLISFPWLFEKELARIATGIEVGEDLDSQGLRPLVLRGDPNHPRKRGAGGDVDFEDFIQQDDGVIVHRGEILDLFRPDVDSEDLSGESDFEEARREHSIIADESSDIVPIASVKAELVPDHLLSGTGLEDIIPQVKLDGLTDPRKVAQHAHSLSTPNNKPHLEGSPSEDTSINGNATLPPEASVKTVDDHLKPDTPENISPEEEGVEEEVVELEVEKTALEKLAEMMAG